MDGMKGYAMLPIKIAGLGCYLPARRVTNAELEERLGIPARWIERATPRHPIHNEQEGVELAKAPELGNCTLGPAITARRAEIREAQSPLWSRRRARSARPG